MNTIGSGKRSGSASPSDEPPAKRARADSPGPPAVASGSSLPIAPRQRDALTAAVASTMNHLRAPLPASNEQAAQKDWRATALTHRLDLARVASAIAHEDPLPPEPANQATAKLVAGSKLIRLAAEAAGLNETGRNSLAALLLQAQHQARNTYQLGLAPTETLPMELVTGAPGSNGWVDMEMVPGGDVVVGRAVFTTRNGLEPQTLGGVAHESVHEGQELLRHRPIGDGHASTQTGVALTPREARAGFLAMGTGLPLSEETVPPTEAHPLHKEHYYSQPRELQAFLEESHVAGQSTDAARPLRAEMQPLLLAVVVPLLKAARGLDVPQPPASPSTPAHEVPLRRYESSRHAGTFEHVARIVDTVVDLDVASQSRGAQPPHVAYWAASVQREMANVVAPSGAPPEALAEIQMHHLRRTLEHLIGQLPALGVNSSAPALKLPSLEMIRATKSDPLSTAARALRLSTEEDIDRLALSLDRTLTGSGLLQHVAELKALPADAHEAQQRVVGAAITGVAAHWLGIEPRELPPLDIHLYDAPNRTLPHVEGMNLHAGQARKARFELGTWQVHLPRHLLDLEQHGKLPGHLAKLGFDAAHAADIVRGGRMTLRTHDKGLVSISLAGRILVTERSAQRMRQTDPFAAPALLRRALAPHPSPDTVSQAGSTFHQGPRAALKLDARHPDPAVARPAAEGFAIHSMLRWHDPAVALRRAFGALADEMAGEANHGATI